MTGNQILTSEREVTSSGPSQVCWGIWDISFNPSTRTVDIVPLRQAAFNANVTIFLQPPTAPANLLKLQINPTSDFDTGYIDCDVTLEHPFKARPMYRGFDVRGIFMADGTHPVECLPGLDRTASDEARLLNADGYTRWWNSSEFGPEGELLGFQTGKLGYPYKPSATLNGYMYFADDLNELDGVESLDPATRGTFATFPGINTRNYQLQFALPGGAPDFKFQYAVDTAWEEPDGSFEPDYPIEAFGENAQVREPYHLILSDLGSSAYYEDPDTYGGQLNLAIEVFDWQTPESGVSTELSALFLESDTFAAPVDVLPLAYEYPGSQVTSRTYSVVLDDLTLTHAGLHEVFIAAVSSEGTYEPNIPTGGTGWMYPHEPLAAFALGYVNILGESQNDPPVAIADDSGPLTGYPTLTVHFDPAGSFDPNEPDDFIVLYEWDFDNDGTYDISNTDGAVVGFSYTDPDTYYAQLRVTDSFNATDTLDTPLEIIVLEGVDEWPMGFYDENNTCFNPNSIVTPPLSLVYDVDLPGNQHSQLTIGRGKIYMIDSGGYLRVLNQSDGTELWIKDIKTMGSYWTGASAALWGNDVFTGGTGVWSFDADDGTENWHIFTTASFDHQGQVIVDGTIYFRSSSGSLVSLAVDDGFLNWSSSWSEQPLFPPVYGEVGNQGYIAAPRYSSLRCVNADTGVMAWEQSTGGSIYHNPIVIGDYVYYGGYDGTLYKTNLQTGVHDTTYDLAGYQPLGMWLSSTDLFMVTRLGSSDYQLMSFDFDLNLNWAQTIVNSCEQGVYSDGYVYLAVRLDGSEMQMVAYDADDGSEDFVHPTKFNYTWGGITNVGNRLYIADNYSRLLCYESQ